MKARRLPQDGTVPEVLGNLQEIIWSKIATGINRFIKAFIENLLKDELTVAPSAMREARNARVIATNTTKENS